MRNTHMYGLIGGIYSSSSTGFMPIDWVSGLNSLGCLSRHFTDMEGTAVPAVIRELFMEISHNGLRSFVIGANGWRPMPLKTKTGQETSFYDLLQIPFISLMTRHPARYIRVLEQLPANSIVTYSDGRHEDFLDDLGIPPARRYLCPLGGPSPLPSLLPTRERKYDVFFYGDIDIPDRDQWLYEHSNGVSSRRKILEEILDAVRYGEDAYTALKACFNRGGERNGPRFLANFVKDVQAYVDQERRLSLLRSIKNRRVRILGTISPYARQFLEHHNLADHAIFSAALSEMAESKIVLNIAPTRSREAHEIIFYALSRGAFVLTTPTESLKEEIDNQLGLFLLTEENADELIEDLCRDTETMDALRRRSITHYASRHIWKERMRPLLARVSDFMTQTMPRG